MLVSACMCSWCTTRSAFWFFFFFKVAWWERFLGNIGGSSLLFCAALIPSPWLLFKFTVNISLCVGSYLRVNIPGWIQIVNHKSEKFNFLRWDGHSRGPVISKVLTVHTTLCCCTFFHYRFRYLNYLTY